MKPSILLLLTSALVHVESQLHSMIELFFKNRERLKDSGYILSIAWTRYVSINGRPAQNHSLAKMSKPNVITVEIPKYNQYFFLSAVVSINVFITDAKV